MHNIIIVQCLYCPDSYFLQKSIDSIISLDSLLSDQYNLFNFTIYLEGYFGNSLLYNKYSEIISKLNIKVTLKSSPNLGKSAIINNLSLSKDIDIKYIMVVDSDIIFTSIDFTKLISTCNYENIGLVALNQKEDNRHNNINNKTIHIDNVSLLYSDNCVGVAGGCFFIKKEILDRFPYPDVGIYGMDDTIYHQTLYSNGYLVVIAKDIYVIHPFNYVSTEYNNWKLDRCLNFSKIR